MSHLRFSPEAARDIDGIWDYTAVTWGIDQAESYTDAIRDICFALASGERQGRKVDVREGYFKCPVGQHFVFFRKTDVGIVVVRVLHHSMDAQRHL